MGYVAKKKKKVVGFGNNLNPISSQIKPNTCDQMIVYASCYVTIKPDASTKLKISASYCCSDYTLEILIRSNDSHLLICCFNALMSTVWKSKVWTAL